MSIDNIQLPGNLCQIMFKKSLLELTKPAVIKASLPLPETIETEAIEPDPIQTTSHKTIISLGENKGHILFLVNNPENKFLGDEEMKLLSDLLTACKISMADIALVNYHQHPEVNYHSLSDQFKSKKILVFGVTSSDLELPFTIPFFQLQKFQEQLYMMSPSLSDFLENVALKKELWNSLKKIFLLQK